MRSTIVWPLEGGHVFSRPIGGRPIGVRSNILRGVELGGVGGEGVDEQAGMAREEHLDVSAPMDRAPVVQEDHRPSEVPEQVAEEGPDLQPSEVPRPATEMKGQAAVPGEHGHAGDGREPVAAVAVVQVGRVAFARQGVGPCLPIRA